MRGSDTRLRRGAAQNAAADSAAPGTPPQASADPAFGEYVHVDELPEAIHSVPPEYPERARAAGISGTVMVQVLVARDGQVREVKIVKSIPELDEAAIEAARQYRFKPARSEEVAVPVWVAVPMQFPPPAR